MRPEEIRALLDDVRSGRVDVDESLAALRRVPVEDVDFARIDLHREQRQGLAEAIFAEGKTPEQVVAIAQRLVNASSGPVLATRVDDPTAAALKDALPQAVHHPVARMVVVPKETERATALGEVLVVSAGTSDIPVAEEAAVTAEVIGARVDRIVDVGVAGVHRVLGVQDRLHEADVVIVVAGMEGALASLVGGITSAPVVAVPTSVGYGASFEGLAALLAMLNSCAAGITVTNIDNGFGAAMFALRVLRSKYL